MARLLWPGDYEWMFLTNDLRRGRLGPDPESSDGDGPALGEDGKESESTTMRTDRAPYTCPTTKNGHSSSE